MSRQPLLLRQAVEADAEVVAACWSTSLRKGDEDEQVTDARNLIKLADDDPSTRVVIAEYDGEVAGACYLKATTVSPVNLEPVVQAAALYVIPAHRRHGVGHALMEQAVAFAEGLGIGLVSSAVPVNSRDTNRFFARLGLTQSACARVAPTVAVRGKLGASSPRKATPRNLTRLLAARRSQREREREIEVAPQYERPVTD